MNFQKYEQEMNHYLNENYHNLKRTKIANSEFALKELLQSEQADINNYARGLVSKIIKDVRKGFVAANDAEKGYELGEQYKALLKAPVFNQIQVDFAKEVPLNDPLKRTTNHQQSTKRPTTQDFVAKSPANRYRAKNIAVSAGVTTAVIGVPAAMLLTEASLGTSLLVVGLSAIVVAGIVYTVVTYMDDNGKQQTSYVVPTQTSQKAKSSPTTTKSTKKLIDQASLSRLLDIRKSEAQKVLLKTIQDAKQKYEQLQTQVQ